MVAIPLYKGNLHKVPDVPRRWPPPAPKISRKEFQLLVRRRDMALSRLRDVSGDETSSPSRDSSPNHSVADRSSDGGEGAANDNDGDEIVDRRPQLLPKGDLEMGEAAAKDEGKNCSGGLTEKTDVLMEEQKIEEEDKPENNNTETASGDVERRKKEVMEKLEILNEKKHSLVQVLKQILSAEEHLKRHNVVQGTHSRPPLQVDTTTDSGSMTKVNTPRVGPDGNPLEGGEGDGVSNHNFPLRNLPRMSSTSSSSDSQLRKPSTSSMVPHSYRTTLGAATSSPSRFAPVGQGQHTSVNVTVSGASYIASSPSPAASGGTSVFRDGRLPSPWS